MTEILFEYLRKQTNIIIYGAGANGRFLSHLFNRNTIKVNFFCDSNEELWGQTVDGTECIAPVTLKKYGDAVVIVSPVENGEIKNRLKKYCFKKVLYWEDIKFLKDKFWKLPEQILREILSNDRKLATVLQRNKRFRNIHSGRRCFILGNGPSLQNVDLFVLANEITFTVNQISRYPQFKDINTNYHLWADGHFFKTEAQCQGDYDLLKVVKNLPDDAQCFFRYDNMRAYIEKFEIDKYININYYEPSSLVDEETEIDFSWFIRGAYTVVQYAMQLAVYMGINEIYLLGCDCTAIMNTINSRLSTYTFKSHCYDIDENERERAKRMYTELPLQKYYQSEIEILNGYERLNHYCRDRNIKIYNCTQGGLLEEFPRKSLTDVFNDR